MKINWTLFLYLVTIFSCNKETEPINNESFFENETANEIYSTCDSSKTPIVFVHGFLASGDTWELQEMLFTSNNYCADIIFQFDWNSTGFTSSEDLLDTFIDEVLEKTGSDKIHLVGHSAGGGLAYGYCATIEHANKIEKYVHVGSSGISGPAGPGGEIPTLNLYSPDDLVSGGSDIAGCENISIEDKDHYQIATSAESFYAMYSFFNDVAPISTEISEDEIVCISGRVVTLGENAPFANKSIEVFALDTFGFRLNETADYIISTDAKGYFPRFQIEKNTYYEFFVEDSEGRNVHYYREPFTHNDDVVYLRLFPPPFSLAGFLLAGVPEDDNQSVAIVFGGSQAFINGRDNLFINEIELSNSLLCAPENTTIALFCYDADADSFSDETSIGIFELGAFLKGIDVYFSTEPEQTILCNFNDRLIRMKNWKSETDGVSIAVFN